MRYPYSSMTSFKNHLDEITKKYNPNGVRHDYGEGGVVMQRPVSYQGEDFLEIILESVPLADARIYDSFIATQLKVQIMYYY